MTLLVGVLCRDGAVIAADRQATHGALGQRTVGQATTKIQLLGATGLFASSGHHGLGQQLAAVIDRRHPEFVQQAYDRFIPKLQVDLRELVKPALETAGLAARVYGNQIAMQDATCGSLLAAPFKDRLHLIEITPQVAVETLTAELPFVTLGSGKGSADPFLGFLRKVYWPEGLPSVRDATLAAYWTVKHAIDMKVDGVGFDADVFQIEVAGKNCAAKQLTKDDLAEHMEFIQASEEALRKLRDGLAAPEADGAIAAPPTLPPTIKAPGA